MVKGERQNTYQQVLTDLGPFLLERSTEAFKIAKRLTGIRSETLFHEDTNSRVTEKKMKLEHSGLRTTDRVAKRWKMLPRESGGAQISFHKTRVSLGTRFFLGDMHPDWPSNTSISVSIANRKTKCLISLR